MIMFTQNFYFQGNFSFRELKQQREHHLKINIGVIMFILGSLLHVHQCGLGSIRPGRLSWVEFVGFRLCTERVFPGHSGFPLTLKTKTWFDLWWVHLKLRASTKSKLKSFC